ncbi:unnamed protein product, partial [Polarella glacialis]
NSATGKLAAYLAKLLQARHETFPERQAIFDLQDVQCRVCGQHMASGDGTWFGDWGGYHIIIDAKVAAVLGLGVLVASLTSSLKDPSKQLEKKGSKAVSVPVGGSQKKAIQRCLKSKRLRPTPPKRPPAPREAAKSIGLTAVIKALPVKKAGQARGVQAGRVADLFGYTSRTEIWRAMKKLTEKHDDQITMGNGSAGWLLCTPCAACRFILCLPDKGRLSNIRDLCSRVLVRAAHPPNRQPEDAEGNNHNNNSLHPC